MVFVQARKTIRCGIVHLTKQKEELQKSYLIRSMITFSIFYKLERI